MKLTSFSAQCLGVLVVFLAAAPVLQGAEIKTVEDGRKVGIEYTLKLEDGSTFASNIGQSPLVFTVGAGEILPALQKAMTGMRVGDRKEVKLGPEDAYGPVYPDHFQKVKTSEIPEDARVPGAQLTAKTERGDERHGRVHEVGEEEITLDFNHPLAGQSLTFDIKVVSIE